MGAVRDRVREEGSRGERSEGEGVGSRGKRREGLRGKRGLGHQLSLRGGRARVMFEGGKGAGAPAVLAGGGERGLCFRMPVVLVVVLIILLWCAGRRRAAEECTHPALHAALPRRECVWGLG